MSRRQESSPTTLADKVEQLHTVTRIVQTVAVVSSSFFVFAFLIYAYIDVDDYEYLQHGYNLFNLTYHICITTMMLLNGFSAFTMIAHCIALQNKYQRIVYENYNIFAIDFYRQYIEDTHLLRTLSQICTVVSFFLLYVALILFTLCTTAFSLQTFIFSVSFAIGLLCNIFSALKIFGFTDLMICTRNNTSTHHLKRTLHLSAHQLASQTCASSTSRRKQSKSDDNGTTHNTFESVDGHSGVGESNTPQQQQAPTMMNIEKRSLDLSVTGTEMTGTEDTNEFDSRELAMVTVASGHVFDYRTDVIHEEDEHEHEREHGHELERDDEDSKSGLFPYVNADGIEETEEDDDDDDDDDDEDVAISEFKEDQSGSCDSSETTVEQPIPPHMQSNVTAAAFTANTKSDIVEDGCAVDDTKSDAFETMKLAANDSDDDDGDHDDHANAELIDVISKAISNENNKARELPRQSTEDMLDTAHDLLHGLSGVISLGGAEHTIGGFFGGAVIGAEQGDEDEEEDEEEEESSSYESDGVDDDEMQLNDERSLTDEYDQNMQVTGGKYNLLTMFAKSTCSSMEARSGHDCKTENIKRFYAE
mmetsp:Transcript_39143/g.64010  ORF Transcript_39143/g.64010 Transcript_39143/m.64010 type:complete len:590 (-) Transcript_39143:245-2014(-)